MDCRLIDERLVAFQSGALAELDDSRLERHLASCTECLRSFFDVRRAMLSADRAGDAPPTRILQRLLRDVARRRVVQSVPFRIALAAAAAAVAIMFAAAMRRTPIDHPSIHVDDDGRKSTFIL